MNADIETIIRSANEELIEKGNLDVVAKVFSPEYAVHASGKTYAGHEFIKKWARQIHSALPDIRVVGIDVLNQTEDTIVWMRTLKGTHKGRIMGIPPTNHQFEWREMVVSRFENNQIHEEWAVSELAGHLLSKPPIVP